MGQCFCPRGQVRRELSLGVRNEAFRDDATHLATLAGRHLVQSEPAQLFIHHSGQVPGQFDVVRVFGDVLEYPVEQPPGR